ncbi:transmembrane emp24 domain-containing protein 7 [Toxorhynchites rutilus septentrionalis]|uniref:transmembrane emp24 domain-containing protein 7 n=1 Tax=Toxorhynchites rutilus septentrionalis TaxID=329112 RepID=UPI00247AF982|nr:transmembrane emp24 domain-containing protein 7 [Toxorhynchites rutilus septentrionalis]
MFKYQGMLASGILLLAFAAQRMFVDSVELTFELPDNARECFYEEIKKNQTATLEFQVVTGGHYDVDVSLESPTKEILYRQVKTQFDSHQFTAQATGIYVVCFSNEFSTFSHKLIYVDFQVGDEQPLPGIDEHASVLTQLETSAQEIHKSLNAILDYQTHHRLRETQGRKRAEDLNERVLWWSITETIAVLVIAVGQVIVLRNFFSEKKPSQMNYQQFQ